LILTGGEGHIFSDALCSPDGKRILYSKCTTDGVEWTLETCDPKGSSITVLLSGVAPPDFWWLPDGRIIYALPQITGVPYVGDSNLWQLKVDPGSGQAISQPKRLTNWAGFWMAGLNASADGKRLVFMKRIIQGDVYVGQLQAAGTRLKTPRRLTLDDRNDFPFAWTVDSKAVLFVSDRTGGGGIYKQYVDEPNAELLATTDELAGPACLSPDGAWVLYCDTPPPGVNKPVRVMRVPVAGGAAELLFSAPSISDIRCARSPASLCAVSQLSSDQRRVRFTAVDPVKGQGRELTAVAADLGTSYSWDLSPDGSQIALVKNDPAEGRVRFLSLAGQAPRDLVVEGQNNFSSVDWSTDSKALFIARRDNLKGELLRLDLTGRAVLLWTQGHFFPRGIPSPNGQWIAIRSGTADSNVWMLENF
jgi:Tol biopolymer transport system component